ncbi:MAG TPA: PEP-CTERM sorting domain-containing protein [Burkholderiaceae bacterium]|nr:PEP-CTERM sorting domain-containing protein [Burkholderiaceae bacterium]HQR72492.1 PEP-CTERM sorting domain-containing protein [Burkholderiaceae bacterium]
MLGAVALVAADHAAAELLSVFVAPNSGMATQTCSGVSGPITSPHDPVRTDNACTDFFGTVGTSSGSAISAAGHVGASAHADSHNGNSLVSGIGANAIYSDFLTFTSSSPGLQSTSASVNLALDGIFDNSGPFSVGQLTLKLYLGSSTVPIGELDMLNGGVTTINGLSVTSGALGPVTNAQLLSSSVNLGLNTPIFFEIDLLVGAGASGPGSHALIDFGSSSVKLVTGSDAFVLPAGVTVNAGDYLVNNRFIDPLTPPTGNVPEPASLALTLAALALVIATRRRGARNRLVS